MDLLTELAIIIVSAAILAFIARLFKQPIIPAYILAGLLLVLTGIGSNSFVETISQLGIAFLLFIVGLEIDLNRIKEVGVVATIGGTLLCVVLFWIGFGVSLLLSFTRIEAAYIGLVLAFSSTMIVVKILADRNELDTLHGRITIGILLVQDVLAIISLFVLSSLNNFNATKLVFMLTTILAVVALTYIIGKVILPIIFKHAAKSEEILFITAVAVCLIFIGIFQYLGLSVAIGAFLAGLTLGNLPYNFEIISLVKPLRDFFSVIFFVLLGMQLDIRAITSNITIIIVLIALIILIKPLLIMIVVSFFGYKKQPSYLTSIGLAQTSEFSLILAVFGVSVGHISKDLFSSVIFITIITMAMTAYLFEYEKKIYRKISGFLELFERASGKDDLENVSENIKKDVILVGCDRLGSTIFNALRKLKQSFIVVDYNPEIIKDLIKKRIPCLYGDIGDLDILHRLNLKGVKMIISTVPDKQDSILLIRKAKELRRNTIVMVTSMNIDDAIELYEEGADYVILPHFLGGERVSLLLEEVRGDINKVLDYKLAHLQELRHRIQLGHRHPKRSHS
jgi:Kef-type K+ transport system membrane component KefB